jgi:hypothetical protein
MRAPLAHPDYELSTSIASEAKQSILSAGAWIASLRSQ